MRAFALAVALLALTWSATAAFGGATSAVVRGTFSSLSIDALGTSISFDTASGKRTVRLAPDARIEEQITTTSSRAVPVTSLVPFEPLAVTVKPSGEATLVLATYQRVSTRLVIVDKGYLIASNGNAYRLVGSAMASVAQLPMGEYLVLHVDPATNEAFDLIASRSPLTAEGTPARSVAVTFVVEVPVNTPSADTIYMATSSVAWTPNAVRMSPLPGNKWTATLHLTGGTLLSYKYTRGSWLTDERNPAGVEIQNRSLSVTSSSDAQNVSDVVQRWADLSS